ncbi:MAG: hypothetical protein ISS15_12820 [Alphaproteobacteria bacterium]|nr:hypothetical protein [Alphaproteobacteria bacterium]MBL7098533.1 hypothetical protein [Alphaproteobacteria bacterium]
MTPPSLLRSPGFKIGLVVVGITGLAALGVALFGARRFNDEILKPVSAATLLPLAAAAAPQAERAWAETRPWRDYVARVLSSVNTAEVREQVAERLAHWIDRFR